MCCFSPIFLLCQTFVWNAAAPLMRPLSAKLSLILRSLVGHEPLMRFSAKAMSWYFHLLFQVPIFVGALWGRIEVEVWAIVCLISFPGTAYPVPTHPPAPTWSKKRKFFCQISLRGVHLQELGSQPARRAMIYQFSSLPKGLFLPPPGDRLYIEAHGGLFSVHHFISVILILILTVMVIIIIIIVIIIIIICSTGVYEAWLEVPPHVVMFIRSPGKTHLIHFFCHQPQPGNFFQSIRFDSLSKLLFFIGDMPRKKW